MVQNTMLRSKTKIADVGEKKAKLKWEWAGDVSRMHSERVEMGRPLARAVG